MKRCLTLIFYINTLITSVSGVDLPVVLINQSGNSPDPLTDLGTVNYDYYISKYEVTNTQYAIFLNAVAKTDTFELYNTNMGNPDYSGGILRVGSPGNYSYTTRSGYGNKPVNFVSFWNVARFANWLTNGQPTGQQDNSTTETGVYMLNGVAFPVNASIGRNATAWSAGGVAIANQDEWHKAAYYDPNAPGEYWTYPTRSNTEPSGAQANYNPGDGSNPGDIAEVGYSIPSYFGTYDQGGNVREWTEDTIYLDHRVVRGGAFGTGGGISSVLLSTLRNTEAPETERNNLGFRLTSLKPITAPTTDPSIIEFQQDISIYKTVQITFESQAGMYYNIQHSFSLNSDTWVDSPQAILGTGSTITRYRVTDGTLFFFRICESPSPHSEIETDIALPEQQLIFLETADW
ncbi:formylglycine-generating enzyme family protein [Cerasicoccus fimbriatus]|uniref:formylglycine-generating enzyme family protein n=1 Tax=Cerasicoccus fimbriatus TaxID=3014554 RepID=UPI0022B4EEEE|nr:SUMF1/EgtB/PvdO family nonheme iron enzyme [Cerasicoccus sp. TK19100]